MHQMLVTFPIGAFGLAVASDALHGVSGERRYADAAQLALDVGLITAGVAIPFGLVDWLSIPRGTSARRTGIWHAASNVAMLGLFGASRWLRSRESASARAKALSGAAFLLSGVAAWFGGELVDHHGIGVKGVPAPAALPWDTSEAPQPTRAAPLRTPVTPG